MKDKAKKDRFIGLRIPQELYDAMAKEAEQDGMRLSAYMRLMLERRVVRRSIDRHLAQYSKFAQTRNKK